MPVLGVDGCRGSWLAAASDGGKVSWRLVSGFRELYDDPAAEVIAVDIPIGLPEAGVRSCDASARQLLGRRGVSVFAAPVRPVLACSTYQQAREVLAGLGGASMSAQAFGLRWAVADVDACVQPSDDDRIVEAHPEVAFYALGGGPSLPAKRTARGAAARLRLLSAWRDDVLDLVAQAPDGAPLDDALDALACLWVAERWASGHQATLGDGERDAHHLPMRIAPAPGD